jgi:CO dehydrogenase maturation factor
VVEPGRGSIETACRIRELAKDIGLQNIGVVGNKIRSEKDRDFLISIMPDFEFLGFILYDPAIVEADLAGSPLVNSSHKAMSEVKAIAARLNKAKRRKLLDLRNN